MGWAAGCAAAARLRAAPASWQHVMRPGLADQAWLTPRPLRLLVLAPAAASGSRPRSGTPPAWRRCTTRQLCTAWRPRRRLSQTRRTCAARVGGQACPAAGWQRLHCPSGLSSPPCTPALCARWPARHRVAPCPRCPLLTASCIGRPTSHFHPHKQVACFDTEFHQTMPPEAYTYALPRQLAAQHGIRRYGALGGWARGREACSALSLLSGAGGLSAGQSIEQAVSALVQEAACISLPRPGRLCRRLSRDQLLVPGGGGGSHAGQAARRRQPDPVPPGWVQCGTWGRLNAIALFGAGTAAARALRTWTPPARRPPPAGAGSSMCAVAGGRCVDTTMGLTPLEGLMMGTRCGALCGASTVDPAQAAPQAARGGTPGSAAPGN